MTRVPLEHGSLPTYLNAVLATLRVRGALRGMPLCGLNAEMVVPVATTSNLLKLFGMCGAIYTTIYQAHFALA